MGSTASLFRSSRDLTLLACSINGLALRYATPVLRKDSDLVRVAVSRDWRSLRFADQADLCDNTELIRQCVKLDGLCLEHASLRLRCDREIVREAVAQNHDALLFAEGDLRRDPEFIVELMEHACA
ncbi:unnamed protein product, partial [Amoebophrya sp. A120]|eukprot:GSA120T00012271001.1